MKTPLSDQRFCVNCHKAMARYYRYVDDPKDLPEGAERVRIIPKVDKQMPGGGFIHERGGAWYTLPGLVGYRGKGDFCTLRCGWEWAMRMLKRARAMGVKEEKIR